MPAPDSLTVIADLEAEQDAIEAMLADLGSEDWLRPSAAVGWSIADVDRKSVV